MMNVLDMVMMGLADSIVYSRGKKKFLVSTFVHGKCKLANTVSNEVDDREKLKLTSELLENP